METICPTCSATVSGEYAVGDLVDCPACGATFEARAVATPVSVDDVLRRAERQAAEQRLREGFDALGHRICAEKHAEKFDRAIAGTDRFAKGASKIGKNLLLGVLLFPLLLYALFILWGLIFS